MSEPSRILIGDVNAMLATLPAGSVHCCVTSPPYWGLRDYGVEGQIGLEATPEAYIELMVEVFRGVARVLREDGTCWLNIGDSYAGSGRGGYEGRESTLDGSTDGQNSSRAARVIQMTSSRRRDDAMIPRSDGRVQGLKPKDLCMMPWRLALALQADGWWIRSVIVWAKKSPMPESCRDRPTSSWEPIFLLSRSERYFYDAEAVKEASEQPERSGKTEKAFSSTDPNVSMRNDVGREVMRTSSRNQRNVWHLGPEPYAEAHFATFPTEIPRRCISAGTSEKGCCPACGACWVRVMEKVSTGKTQKMADGWDTADGAHGTIHRAGREKGETGVPVMTNRTTGWQPGCDCIGAGDPVPCLVLDPFLGSGTSVAVARTLGRHGVGIEINPVYAELARVRIGKAENPGTFRDMNKVHDAPLFTG